MYEIKTTAVKKRKKKRSTNPAVRVLKILGTALLSIFLILIITCSIFATVLTIYVLNFADTTTTISLDKTETSNISRFLSVNPDYDEDDVEEKATNYLKNIMFVTNLTDESSAALQNYLNTFDVADFIKKYGPFSSTAEISAAMYAAVGSMIKQQEDE